ncbi:Mini-chromosome maintenance complex-binding protein [Halotydeus destructor]|nr:Mini-chromosome maintenance complex-binding protein [Halotydeus destructor]
MDVLLSEEGSWRQFLIEPVDKVDKFFEGDSTIDPIQLHKLLAKSLENKFSESSCSEIPTINHMKSLDTLKSGSCVRFYCAIQDMFDPEYYLAAYEKPSKERGLGLYRDQIEEMAEHDATNSKSVTESRLSYFCISVPGENEWVRETWLKKNDTCNEEVLDSQDKVKNKSDTNDGNEAKRLKSANVSEIEDESRKKVETHLNKLKLCHPACDVNPNKRACIVKLYEDNQSFKLNDVIEVVGSIQFDNSEAALLSQQKSHTPEQLELVNSLIKDMDMEDHDEKYPSSLVPRIHAFYVRKINHINPLVDSKVTQEFSKDSLSKLRTELHAILSQALFGDQLAADYVICNLISSIYSRKDILTLGAFPLNVSNFPKMTASELNAYVKSLYTLLARLQTHSVYMPMALQNLNKSAFVPEKDYTNNKLNSGLLQLSEGTFMLVDETALSAGQLAAEGVANLNTLTELIKWQKVRYNFKYHHMEVDTDVKVLVLSEGRTLLPTAYKVPLRCSPNIPVSEIFPAIEAYLDEHLLNGIRTYITLLRNRSYNLTDEVQKRIQDDFVEMRQKCDKVGPDDLHSLLTVARLFALSLGDTELTLDAWEQVKKMETDRMQRQ